MKREEEEKFKMKSKMGGSQTLMTDKNFIIKDEELDHEKAERLAEKKKKFYEEFKPDFDLDEVPDLE